MSPPLTFEVVLALKHCLPRILLVDDIRDWASFAVISINVNAAYILAAYCPQLDLEIAAAAAGSA
eukprot:3974940-Pleurochrysis_carterae.AAC.1